MSLALQYVSGCGTLLVSSPLTVPVLALQPVSGSGDLLCF